MLGPGGGKELLPPRVLGFQVSSVVHWDLLSLSSLGDPDPRLGQLSGPWAPPPPSRPEEGGRPLTDGAPSSHQGSRQPMCSPPCPPPALPLGPQPRVSPCGAPTLGREWVPGPWQQAPGADRGPSEWGAGCLPGGPRRQEVSRTGQGRHGASARPLGASVDTAG